MPDAFHLRAHRRFPGSVSVSLAACLLTSCAAFHRRPPPAADAATAKPSSASPAAAAAAAPATNTSTPTAHRIGTVRVIGHARRFVLVEVPPSATNTLPDGQLLRCAADPSAAAPVTATLRVGRERRRPYVVADVVGGEPHVGDAVFIAPESPAANNTPGPLVLPTATSGVLPIVLPGANANPSRP